MAKVRKGDKICALGITVTIEKVLYWDCFDDEYDVEFIDTAGNYRHWKQWEDGGFLIKKTSRAYDWYGQDVTDLYIKYGQPI